MWGFQNLCSSYRFLIPFEMGFCKIYKKTGEIIAFGVVISTPKRESDSAKTIFIKTVIRIYDLKQKKGHTSLDFAKECKK